MNKPKLIIMVGNIVSGKSTWIRNYLTCKKAEIDSMHDKYVVLSKDDIRRMIGAGNYIWDEDIEPIVHSNLLGMLHDYMSCGINIIYDETNMDVETRKPFLSLTKKYHRLGYDYETIAVIMPKVSTEKTMFRIAHYRACKPEYGNFSQLIWEGVYKRKQDKFEMPTKEEGFDEIWRIK